MTGVEIKIIDLVVEFDWSLKTILPFQIHFEISSSVAVLCLRTLRWPTNVTAKRITSGQKEKTHGKKNNLAAKRIRLMT